jgi:dihydroxyacetone kinase-like predicted kinase
LTSAGRCQAGDVLGLIAGEVVAIGSDVVAVGEFVIDRLLGVGGELVTVLLGAQAPPGAGIAIGEHLARTAAHVEFQMLPSGQPDQPLLIGVE